jgi:hypothetical protein
MDGLTAAGMTLLLDAWTVIGSFVAVSLLVARLAESLADGRTVRLLSRRGIGPLGGAALGAIPGCGGAIAVVSLYGRGTARFGTVLAALVATAGDSAFVLLTVAPRIALVTYGITFLTGVVLGVVATEFGLAPDRVKRTGRAVGAATGDVEADGGTPQRRGGRLASVLRTSAVTGWWLAAVVGLAVGLHRMIVGGVPQLPGAGLAVGVPTLAAVLGVTLSIGLSTLPDPPVRGGSFRTAAVAAAVKSAPIVTWVVAALAGYRALVATIETGALATTVAGPAAVVTGGLLGAIPGCGVHVGVVTAYADGVLPLSAIVANAISQDGDALFALLAVDRTAAVVATVYTVVPGVAVGLAVAAL